MAKKKYIETPQKMWELFLEYKKEVKENPKIIVEQKKSSTSIKAYGGADVAPLKKEIEEASKPLVEMPRERPLTMEGFENYVADKDLNTELSHYFSNKDERYSKYVAICSRIRRVIRQDQIEGGMVNIYNPSITQRLNNLTDKKDITTNGKEIIPPTEVIMPDGVTVEEYLKKQGLSE